MKYDYSYLYNRNTKRISILPWKLHKWTLCGLLGIKKLNTTSLTQQAYYPQFDGLVERFTPLLQNKSSNMEQKTTLSATKLTIHVQLKVVYTVQST